MKLLSKLFLLAVLTTQFTHASSLDLSVEAKEWIDKAASILKDKSTRSKDRFQILFETMKQVPSIGPKPCLEEKFPKAILLAQLYYREIFKGLIVGDILRDLIDQLPEDIGHDESEVQAFAEFSKFQSEFFAKMQPFFVEITKVIQPEIANEISAFYEAKNKAVKEAMMLQLKDYDIHSFESPFYEVAVVSFFASCLSEVILKYPSKSELEGILSKYEITEISAAKSSELLAMYQDAEKSMQDHFEETKEILSKVDSFSIIKFFNPYDPRYYFQILSK